MILKDKIHPYTYVGLTDVRFKRKYNVDSAFNNLVELGAVFLGVSDYDIVKQNRRQEYVQMRQIIYSILRFEYGLSLPKIGKLFKRDHSTILHSLKMHKVDLEYDSNYQRKHSYIMRKHKIQW